MKSHADAAARPEVNETPGDAPTRMRVAESILQHGPSTAAVLAERLDVTPAGIRRHLEHLVKDGTLQSRQERTFGQRRRGRPAQVFSLTSQGREQFTHTYDDLATEALAYLQETGGEAAVLDFARHRWSRRADRYREQLDQVHESEKPEALARVLSADGFPSSVITSPAGHQVCQHHCPVANVAEQFPQLCEAETELFAELLGSHVQRLATIAHGDGVCTTHVPHAEPPRATSRSTHTSERVSS